MGVKEVRLDRQDQHPEQAELGRFETHLGRTVTRVRDIR